MSSASRLPATLAAIAAVLLAPAAACAATRASHVPGEVVVRYKRGANRAAVQRDAGVGAPRTLAPHTRVLKIRDGRSVAATVAALRSNPEVATAAPNAIARASAFFPSDPGTSHRSGGWQRMQWNFLSGTGIDAPDAWQHLIDAGHPGGRGAVVAVLDTGVAYDTRGRFRRSPDFRRGDFVPGYDFVDRDRYPNDENGHGTHVAGTIGESTHNDRGVAGLAYGAKLMPVRVLNADGLGTVADITAGVRFAVRHGADVMNLSFEFDTGRRQLTAAEIPELLAALRYGDRHGVLAVASAGNVARTSVAYPAREPSVIAVGATTEHGCRAAYSNVGRDLDLVAPGGGPDAPGDPVCRPGRPGRGIYQMTYARGPGTVRPRAAGGYRRFGLPGGVYGTSMSAPHVAGTAALVIASGLLGPSPTPEAVKARLEQTAVDVGPPGLDDLYGAGRLDAAAATDPER